MGTRSQGLRSIIGLKRDNVIDGNHGAVATQTGETRPVQKLVIYVNLEFFRLVFQSVVQY